MASALVMNPMNSAASFRCLENFEMARFQVPSTLWPFRPAAADLGNKLLTAGLGKVASAVQRQKLRHVEPDLIGARAVGDAVARAEDPAR